MPPSPFAEPSEHNPVLFASGATSRAAAANITSVSEFSTPGFSTGGVGPVGATPAPNDDDVVGDSPNVIPYSIFFNSPGPLETEFNLADSGPTTEYRFTQTFFYTTRPQTAWTGFRFELGCGTGADFVLAQTAASL